jgi:hypothetical protein
VDEAVVVETESLGGAATVNGTSVVGATEGASMMTARVDVDVRPFCSVAIVDKADLVSGPT